MNKRTRKTGANSILTLEASTKQRKNRKKKAPFHPPTEAAPYLQIQSVSLGERVDPERNSYVLVINPGDIRAAGGQYSASEAHEIARATRGWDFSLNPDGQPQCWQRLEALLNRICKRSGHSPDVTKLPQGTFEEVNRIQNGDFGNRIPKPKPATTSEQLGLRLTTEGVNHE